jgi:hypothetical protein
MMPDADPMPMFPLGSVLLPGGLLPLHVFEPRYRQMIIDCLQRDGEPRFGQTLITHGSEAGGGDLRADVGTIARILQIEALDEGRYALVAVGVARIRVTRWLEDDPYPIAEVEEWPDEEPDRPGLRPAIDDAHRRVREVLALAARLGDVSPDLVDHEIADDPVLATYHLAALSPIGPADHYRLLAAPGPSVRLEVLEDVLDDVAAMLKFRLS